ncbi:MAG: HNH endonuclease [Gammaproteobacteria bacterium]|nr:HNH endonuclease [Gammaproteobacteria bacterium]
MLDAELKELSGSVPVILRNSTCVYCGRELSRSIVTREHVIGRRFVPKGKLNGQWNLIVNACASCNGRKADLENDISAVTMHPDAWGKYAAEDQALIEDASRKALNCFSRRTGKPIHKSTEKIELTGSPFPGLNITFQLTSPPQLDKERVFELARMQLMALFYWVTYNDVTKKGGYWLGSYCPLLEASRSDWGNSMHLDFMNSVITWDPRVIVVGADGYFKAAIRRNPSAICWSWAIEWNQKYRVVGFFGEEEPIRDMVNTFRIPETTSIAEAPGKYLRYRSEQPLDEDKDILFAFDNTLSP